VAFAEIAARMEWGECWLTPPPMPRELATELKRLTGGFLPAWATYTASVPWVARACALLTHKQAAHMPLPLVDLISLVVSQDNSCRYCYGATRTILRILGYSEEQVDRIERDLHLSDLSRQEQVALDFARKVSHANPRPTAADRAALVAAGLSPPAVAEIAFMAAFVGFPNRIATLFALQPEAFEKLPDKPLAWIIRPFIARGMRGQRVSPPGLPEPNIGPCHEMVAALVGSPMARLLRTVVDEAFASPVLPRRTKLLMIAVIGRALGCPLCEREARAGLGAEGFSAADVDEVLSNLGSPKLDRRDALLVPFARETVRYQTGAIQRRTRELARELPIEEVIEAAGIASLANAVGRLSIMLETC
jgi:uncharacterized peroxidase-related enzyme